MTKPSIESIIESAKSVHVSFETPRMRRNLYQRNAQTMQNFLMWYASKKKVSHFSMTIDQAFTHYIQSYHARRNQ